MYWRRLHDRMCGTYTRHEGGVGLPQSPAHPRPRRLVELDLEHRFDAVPNLGQPLFFFLMRSPARSCSCGRHGILRSAHPSPPHRLPLRGLPALPPGARAEPGGRPRPRPRPRPRHPAAPGLLRAPPGRWALAPHGSPPGLGGWAAAARGRRARTRIPNRQPVRGAGLGRHEAPVGPHTVSGGGGPQLVRGATAGETRESSARHVLRAVSQPLLVARPQSILNSGAGAGAGTKSWWTFTRRSKWWSRRRLHSRSRRRWLAVSKER